MSEQLKSCPFCGGNLVVLEIARNTWMWTCACGLNNGNFTSKEEAIKSANQRTRPELDVEKIEEKVEEKVEDYFRGITLEVTGYGINYKTGDVGTNLHLNFNIKELRRYTIEAYQAGKLDKEQA